jgi:hypothetical protein
MKKELDLAKLEQMLGRGVPGRLIEEALEVSLREQIVCRSQTQFSCRSFLLQLFQPGFQAVRERDDLVRELFLPAHAFFQIAEALLDRLVLHYFHWCCFHFFSFGLVKVAEQSLDNAPPLIARDVVARVKMPMVFPASI